MLREIYPRTAWWYIQGQKPGYTKSWRIVGKGKAARSQEAPSFKNILLRQRFGGEIALGVSNNKLNHVWMTSRSTENLAGSEELDQVGLRYVHSEVFKLPALLTMWYYSYLSIYLQKNKTGDAESSTYYKCPNTNIGFTINIFEHKIYLYICIIKIIVVLLCNANCLAFCT